MKDSHAWICLVDFISGIYPEDQSKNVELRNAIERLVLNDNSVTVNVESSPALGQGWRLGFLGKY